MSVSPFVSRVALLLLAMGVSEACVAPQTELDLTVVPRVQEGTGRYRKEYLLGPGDTLDVVVLNHGNLSRKVVVRPDGFVSLPVLDDVRAQGLSIRELDEAITAGLSARLVDPEVTVIATSVRPAMVYVFGEVRAVAPIPLRDAATAAQAIARAGGFTDDAAKRYVTVLRLNEDGRLAALTPSREANAQPDPYIYLHNVPLQPDDMIIVPERGIAQFDRWIDSYLNRPLSGVNSVLGTYLSFRLIEFYDEAIDG